MEISGYIQCHALVFKTKATYEVFLLISFSKGDDFRGFEAEKKGSKGPVWSRQNLSKGKEKHITAPHDLVVVISEQHTK